MATKTNRVKKAIITPATMEEAETIMASYAKTDASINKITSQMDIEITKIREKYADELQALGEAREEAVERLQLFAETNDNLFSKKKSIDMSHGTLGFRTGTPKLKLIKGFTWPSVTNLLKKSLPDYVRTVDEPAKDKLLADRDKAEVISLMNKNGIGCEVVQEESFFVELKKEEYAMAD